MSKLPISYPTLNLTSFSMAGAQAMLNDLQRTLQQIAGANNYPDNGPTTARPTQQLQVGQTFFDRTLGAPVWWNGSQWTASNVSAFYETLGVGGFTFFVDTDGGLKVRAPDASVSTLVTSTSGGPISGPAGTFTSVTIGGYTLHVDGNGDLAIINPDGTSEILVVG